MNKRKSLFLFGIIALLLFAFLLTPYFLSEKYVSHVMQSLGKQNFDQLEISEDQRNVLTSFFSNFSTDAKITSRVINKTNHIKDYFISVEQFHYTNDNNLSHIVNGSLLLRIKRSILFQYQIVEISIVESISSHD